MQVRPHRALSTDFAADTEEGGRDDKPTDQHAAEQNSQSVRVFTDCASLTAV